MCGLGNEAARKKLLTESDLTLKAVNISKTTEMASKEAQQLHATSRVHQVSGDGLSEQGPCFCSRKMVHLASICWCKNMDCRNCGKKGHLVQACRNKKGMYKSWNKRDFGKQDRKDM